MIELRKIVAEMEAQLAEYSNQEQENITLRSNLLRVSRGNTNRQMD